MNLQNYATEIMVYVLIGLIFCLVGMYRESKGYTMGDADFGLVFSLMLGWPIYALALIVNSLLKAWKSK